MVNTLNKIKKAIGYYVASKHPISDLERVAYPGQPMVNRMYKTGYEEFFNMLPIIEPNDPLLDQKKEESKSVMQHLGEELKAAPWVHANVPPAGEYGFNRTILGMEAPQTVMVGQPGAAGVALKEGAEILLARWNDFTSPVHGHADGYMHEEIISGRMRVNTYRLVQPTQNKVRLVMTEIVGPGTFVSGYAAPSPDKYFKRQNLIHNFTSVGFATSLHYVPEHTRDGRDNGFEVEYFDDISPITKDDVKRINSFQGMYLQKGDVVLVRSSNVPEYGDHYIVVTGPPVMKDHGFRIQDVALTAPHNTLLDQYEMETGLILLQLKKDCADKFLSFHGITMEAGEVKFPAA